MWRVSWNNDCRSFQFNFQSTLPFSTNLPKLELGWTLWKFYIDNIFNFFFPHLEAAQLLKWDDEESLCEKKGWANFPPEWSKYTGYSLLPVRTAPPQPLQLKNSSSIFFLTNCSQWVSLCLVVKKTQVRRYKHTHCMRVLVPIPIPALKIVTL